MVFILSTFEKGEGSKLFWKLISCGSLLKLINLSIMKKHTKEEENGEREKLSTIKKKTAPRLSGVPFQSYPLLLLLWLIVALMTIVLLGHPTTMISFVRSVFFSHFHFNSGLSFNRKKLRKSCSLRKTTFDTHNIVRFKILNGTEATYRPRER